MPLSLYRENTNFYEFYPGKGEIPIDLVHFISYNSQN